VLHDFERDALPHDLRGADDPIAVLLEGEQLEIEVEQPRQGFVPVDGSNQENVVCQRRCESDLTVFLNGRLFTGTLHGRSPGSGAASAGKQPQILSEPILATCR
jgi:hypothetical protein